MKKLEVIAVSIEDIKILNEVDYPLEIELCSGMTRGGFTPNYKVIKECVELSKHPVRVMIRNHDKTFYNTPEQVDMMCNQITSILEFCDPAGFVFGCLDRDEETIDEDALELLTTTAMGYSNTFHKAIDLVLSIENLDLLKDYGIERILTQGGIGHIMNNTYVIEKLAATGMDIICGGGVNIDNITALSDITKHVHMGSQLRIKDSYDETIDIRRVNANITLLQK